ncbi:MAG: pilin [Patescibacteria group bacterium]|jgi:hypothetical protein
MKNKIVLSILIVFGVWLLPHTALAWSIVPKDCIDSPTGCNMCQIVLIFTNASTIIAGILGGTALLNFIIAGLFLIFSNGNEQHIETAKKNLKATIIGLFIVMFAWVGVNYIVRLSYKANTGKDTDATIFGKAWWAPTCETTVKDCAGNYVGSSCVNTTIDKDCGKADARCTCSRTATSGNNTTACSADSKSADYCNCTNKCDQLNSDPKYTGKTWSCMDKIAAEKDKNVDTKTAETIPCPKSTQQCVGKK